MMGHDPCPKGARDPAESMVTVMPHPTPTWKTPQVTAVEALGKQKH